MGFFLKDFFLLIFMEEGLDLVTWLCGVAKNTHKIFL